MGQYKGFSGQRGTRGGMSSLPKGIMPGAFLGGGGAEEKDAEGATWERGREPQGAEEGQGRQGAQRGKGSTY